MAKDAQVSPVVKWVGGKRQLLGAILPLLPEDVSSYCEPFLGGGAVLFALQPARAIVNDLNAELIGVYQTIRDDVDGLLEALRRHANTPEHFYAVRAWDRDRAFYDALSPTERAARLLFLNKTCFNGLFRVNAAGEFNAPFGRYKNPRIVNEAQLRAVSRYFRENEISFHSEDFAATLARVPQGGFVYLDPPYDPVSQTSSFTGYHKGGFDRSEQERLKACLDQLTARGVRFLLSNSATPFIRALYRDYDVSIVQARRAVNADGGKRGGIEEVLVRNYGRK